jgi:hypothetical protein
MTSFGEYTSHFGLENVQQAIGYILDKMKKHGFPREHPFVDFPNTPNSLILLVFAAIKIIIKDDSKFDDILKKKCRSIRDGVFDFSLFNQYCSEANILFYATARMNSGDLKELFIERKVFNNRKLLEYSLLLNNSVLANFEVKTLSCDTFMEENIPPRDGLELIKPFFSENLNDISQLFPSAMLLKSHKNLLMNNLRKIETKYTGSNLTEYRTCNIGIVVVNFSTSLEEFIAYLLHPTYGGINHYEFRGTDAIVLFSLDQKNDLFMDNLYSSGYVITILIHDDPHIKETLAMMRLDNFVAHDSRCAKNEFVHLKVLARNRHLGIIPYDTTEDEINKYIAYLDDSSIRYD